MTKPAPGPDQPPIPVRLVTFNTHHGVGRRRPARPPPAGPGAGGGRRRRHLPAGGRPALRRPQRGRRPGAAALPRPGHAAGVGAGDRRAARRASGPRQYGNALLSRLPILISDVHPLPGGGEPRSALRTMIELDGGALWVTATHLTTGSPERPGGAGRRHGRPAHRPDGDRRRGGRLQRRRRTRPSSAAAAAAVHRRLGRWRRRATTRPAGGSGSATRATPTRRAPRTGGSTRSGCPTGSPSPRPRCSTPAARRTTCRCWSTCVGGVSERSRRSRARAGAG